MAGVFRSGTAVFSSADEAHGPSASEGRERSPAGASTMFKLAELAEGERSNATSEAKWQATVQYIYILKGSDDARSDMSQ